MTPWQPPQTYAETVEQWYDLHEAVLTLQHEHHSALIARDREYLALSREHWRLRLALEAVQSPEPPPPDPRGTPLPVATAPTSSPITSPSRTEPEPYIVPPAEPEPESDLEPESEALSASTKRIGGAQPLRPGARRGIPPPPPMQVADRRDRAEVVAAVTLYLDAYPQHTYGAIGRSLGILPRTVAKIAKERTQGETLTSPKKPLPTLMHLLPDDDVLRSGLPPYRIESNGLVITDPA